jgi:hypothetical protein
VLHKGGWENARKWKNLQTLADRSERTMKREPVAIINAVVTAIQALIPLLLAFGIAQWSPEQSGAISAAVVALGGLLGTFLGRNLVTPVAHPKDNEGRSLRADQHRQIKNGYGRALDLST